MFFYYLSSNLIEKQEQLFHLLFMTSVECTFPHRGLARIWTRTAQVLITIPCKYDFMIISCLKINKFKENHSQYFRIFLAVFLSTVCTSLHQNAILRSKYSIWCIPSKINLYIYSSTSWIIDIYACSLWNCVSNERMFFWKQFHHNLVPPSADPRGHWSHCKLNPLACNPGQINILQGSSSPLDHF